MKASTVTRALIALSTSTALPNFAMAAQTTDPAALTPAAPQAAPGETKTTPPATQQSNELGDIVVTARKTAEKMQDVPIAVTSISGAKLQQQSIMSVQDVQFHVPGFVEYPEAQGGAPDFAIRGAKQQGVSGSQGGVATYLDYVPISSNYSVVTGTYDMQSVQVLKGPQGTLFGKNTTGGAIIFSPNKPTNVLEGYASGQYGNYNRVDLTGMFNLPIADGMGLRVAGRYVKRDAYIKNVGASGHNGDLDSEDNNSFRVSLRLKPVGILTNDIVFDYYHQNQNPNHDRAVGYSSGRICGIYGNDCVAGRSTSFERAINLPLRQNDIDTQNINRGTYWGIANTTSLNLGSVTLRNIFGYRRDKLDSDETSGPVALPVLNGRNNNRQKQTTDEIDLIGKLFDNSLDYTLGVYYANNTYQQRSDYEIFAPNTNTINPALSFLGVFSPVGGGGGLPQFAFPGIFTPVSPSLQLNDFFVKTKAVFGQINYKIDDKLSLTVGARYNQDKTAFESEQYKGYTDITRTARQCNIRAYADVSELIGPCRIRRERTFNSFTGNGSLNFKPNAGTLIYVSAGRGFQAGGYNQQIREPQYRLFNPEKVFTVEAGLKKDWRLADRPIRTNFALFRSNYKGQQRVENGVYSDGSNFIATFNAANSTIWGAEAEINYLPTRQLEVSFFYSYVKAKYDQFISPQIEAFPTADLSGLAIAATPKHTASLNLSYWVPTNGKDGKLRASLNGYYRSGAYYNDLQQDALTYQKGYELLNGRIDLVKTLPFDVGIWMNNITNKTYSLFKFNNLSGLGYSSIFLAPPRTYGVEVSAHF
ncbi:MAG: TonB-dependent receptor [Sphingomicrobium sp.]